MKYAFKTNINCIGCVNQIKPEMDRLEQTNNIKHWRVDLNTPDYLLIVDTNVLAGKEVQAVIQSAGFNAQMVPA